MSSVHSRISRSQSANQIPITCPANCGSLGKQLKGRGKVLRSRSRCCNTRLRMGTALWALWASSPLGGGWLRNPWTWRVAGGSNRVGRTLCFLTACNFLSTHYTHYDYDGKSSAYKETTAIRSHSSTFKPRSTIGVLKSNRFQTRSPPSLKSTQRSPTVSLPRVEPSPRMKIPEVRSYMPLGRCWTSRRLKLVYSQSCHRSSASVKTSSWFMREVVGPEG